ncbi:MAG: hypothetical protein JSV91_10405 [Phycisphaerales bacterium]|nr:MAG: hypothetical protein JSV91_10405 [Phycisphaerales bacterium]
MANCIIRGNTPNEIWVEGGITVEYSKMLGGYAGCGNIYAEPLFADPTSDGSHILAGSPCIDAANSDQVPGDVTTDLGGSPRFVDDPDTEDTGIGDPPIVDMGAYQYQLEDTCPAELNGDDKVNIDDMFQILGDWGPCP